jgi:hypothetical protein
VLRIRTHKTAGFAFIGFTGGTSRLGTWSSIWGQVRFHSTLH